MTSRLSELLRKNAIQTSSGSILNRFKIRKRRIILFFEDILAQYIIECERAGYGQHIADAAEKWMLHMENLMPSFFKQLPPRLVFNSFLKRVWVNIGALDDLKMAQKGDIITIKTRNEYVTRTVGENSFAPGLLSGLLGVFYGRPFDCTSRSQAKAAAEYVFAPASRELRKPEMKEKHIYDRLNHSESTGPGFKTALKEGMLSKKGNRIYFRGKPMMLMENTLFHILNEKQVLYDRIPDISCEFFKDIVEKDTTMERKLLLLKNILQVTGWGSVNIIQDEGDISITISNLPFGMQAAPDSWTFLGNVIKGYMKAIENCQAGEVSAGKKSMTVSFKLQ